MLSLREVSAHHTLTKTEVYVHDLGVSSAVMAADAATTGAAATGPLPKDEPEQFALLVRAVRWPVLAGKRHSHQPYLLSGPAYGGVVPGAILDMRTNEAVHRGGRSARHIHQR